MAGRSWSTWLVLLRFICLQYCLQTILVHTFVAGDETDVERATDQLNTYGKTNSFGVSQSDIDPDRHLNKHTNNHQGHSDEVQPNRDSDAHERHYNRLSNQRQKRSSGPSPVALKKTSLWDLIPPGARYNRDMDIIIEVSVSEPGSPLPSQIKSNELNDPKPNPERVEPRRVWPYAGTPGSATESPTHHDHEHLPSYMDVLYGSIVPMTAPEYVEAGDDWCGKWLNSTKAGHSLRTAVFAELPACPCIYPVQLRFSNKLWDRHHRRHFLWHQSDDKSYHNDVYRRGAATCIRSRPFTSSRLSSVAVQQCCYDSRMSLVTRGRAAGTPLLVSPVISKELHYHVDVLPWVMCQGDWSRYHKAHPPDNRLHCKQNPRLKTYKQQLMQAKTY